MDRSTLHKFQHQFWVTKQTVFRKLGKKEDECIVSSDASLDAKLELFKSIQQTSSMMNKLLDRYQERICYLAQEQNSMGRFLKEYGKADKSGAGKMMIQMGKSLVYCSQQEIGLRPPLLRLYQEVETFRNRAVEDTLDTVRSMEKHRTDYRASLNWMKNVSQELDPDTYRQMEKFRKVQNHVKKSKSQFDKFKLAVLQKVDLLAAARCNMFSHALIQYQNAILKQSEKNARIFKTLANTFRGYQHFEFTFIKDLAEPSKELAQKHGSKDENRTTTDELFFNLDNTESQNPLYNLPPPKEHEQADEDLLNIGDMYSKTSEKPIMTPQDLLSSELLLENLLGGPLDQSPETEQAADALDLTLAWPSIGNASSSASKPTEKDTKDSSLSKEKSTVDYLTEELESCFETETNDTMALLNELLQSTTTLTNISNQGQNETTEASNIPGPIDLLSTINQTPTPAGFLPSQLLLDFGNTSIDSSGLNQSNVTTFDFLNLNNPGTGVPTLIPTKEGTQSSTQKDKSKKGMKGSATSQQTQQPSWYDIFSDIDPIANPDGLTKKPQGDDSC